MDNLNLHSSGEYAFFGTKTAWHKKGQIKLDQAQNSEEAIKLAHLDHEVLTVPLKTFVDPSQDHDEETYIPTGFSELEVPSHYATVRSDTKDVLGVVGSRYEVLQNRDAFRFIDEIVGSKQAIFESAGALGRGERIFLSCKLPEKLVVGQDDVAENYFFLTNSHDGSRVVEIAFTNVFIVCENTLREALRTAQRKQRLRHTKNVYEGLMKGADIMGITRQNIITQSEQFTAMTKVQITDKELRKFIELAMNPKKEQIDQEEFSTRFENKVDEILAYGIGSDHQQIVERKGTLWGAYNAVTGFYNNIEEYKSEDHKLKSIMYGTAFKRSQEALDLAVGVLTNQLTLS